MVSEVIAKKLMMTDVTFDFEMPVHIFVAESTSY